MQPIFNAIIQNDIPAFLGNTPLHLAALLVYVNTIRTLLEFGSKRVPRGTATTKLPPFSLPQHSTEAAILFVDKKHFVSLDELKFAISSGSTFIFSSVAGHPPPFPDPLFLITISFPYSPLHNHPDMPPGSPLALLRRTVKGPRVSISPLMQRISRTDPFPCQKAHNTNGLSPLHLVVLIGSVVVLEEFLEKAPLFFSSLTRSKETVFHLAAGNKNVDGFIFMAERLGINSQKLLQQVDVNGNTVLHIAVSMSCGAPFRNLFSTTATTSIASAFSKQRSSHYGVVRLLTQVIHLGEDTN
uniref:PGG domain-containing protein n=1 Tax=Brassica oleracea TaxID=3712 RepID=A0A3P6CR56_BRAOL|nr:unnamed protein product [Brassica oleracea]